MPFLRWYAGMGAVFPIVGWGRWWFYSWIHADRAANRAASEL